MIAVESAREQTLLKVFEGSKSSVVCSPFFTKDGLSLIAPHLKKSRAVDFILGASLRDWASGVADFDAFSLLLTDLHSKHIGTTLRLFPGLHAKVYASHDGRRAYFGSANLTKAAFATNIEIMTYADGTHVNQLFAVLNNLLNSAESISPTQFQDIVDISKDAIRKAKGLSNLHFDDPDFKVAEELFKGELLRPHARKRTPPARSPRGVRPTSGSKYESIGSPWPDLGQFIRYCEGSRSQDASEIVDRFYGKSNLQGHIKHMFYGCLFFFYENPGMLRKIPSDLLSRGRVHWSDEQWVTDWKKYLSEHSRQSFENIAFAYPILSTYLPEGLGGTQTSGGASSGNFKKVIFLLAKMLQEAKLK